MKWARKKALFDEDEEFKGVVIDHRNDRETEQYLYTAPFIFEDEEEDDDDIENLLPINNEYHAEDLDDLYDTFDDEDDDLTEAENLDEILDKEGIEITDGDTVGNIMEMYNAGFSIIEISKVMNVGGSEVKYVIDSHQGDY